MQTTPEKETAKMRRLTRRRFIGKVASVSIALAANPLLAAQKPTARPNIVFMFCDDIRYDCIGANGNKIIHTPNIDSLAEMGVSFDKSFVTTAICVTSRACIMTGQYAARSGFRHGKKGPTLDQLRSTTYHGILKSSGYQIGYVGKYHVGSPPKNFFDYSGAFAGQGRYEQYGKKHLTMQIGDQALDALEQFSNNRDKPFMLTVGFKSPHVQDGSKPPFYPYDENLTGHLYKDVRIPPPALAEPEFFQSQPVFIRDPKNLNRQRWEWRLKNAEQYQRSVKGYYRLVSGVDIVIGRVVKRLRQLGLSDNTIIVFSSDHGVYLGDRGLVGRRWR